MVTSWESTRDALSLYLLTTGKSEETRRTYVASVSLFFRWAWDRELCPEAADREAVEAFIADQLLHVSNFTARNRLYSLRAYYGFCIARGLRADDPSRGLVVKKPRALPKRALSQGEERRIVFGARSLRDQAMWALLIDTGLRIGEMVRIRIEDIDWQDQSVLIMGKGLKERRLPFGDQTTELLVGVVARRRSGPLWLTKDGKPMSRDRARKNFYNHCKRSRIQAFPHQLRITYANRFLKEGGQLDELQEMLGHADITTTAHYAGDSKRERAMARARSLNLVGRLFE